MVHFFLHSLSYKDLITTSTSLFYTTLVGFLTFLGLLIYFFWDLRVETKRKPHIWEELILRRYTGSSVSIYQHSKNTLEQQWLTSVYVLLSYEVLTNPFIQSLKNLWSMANSIEHPNTDDLQALLEIVEHRTTYNDALYQCALQWLYVAINYWILNPMEEMLPMVCLNITSETAKDTEEATATEEATEEATAEFTEEFTAEFTAEQPIEGSPLST